MHHTPIHPTRGFQAHAVLLCLLDHGEAEIVIVEAVIAAEEEELADDARPKSFPRPHPPDIGDAGDGNQPDRPRR